MGSCMEGGKFNLREVHFFSECKLNERYDRNLLMFLIHPESSSPRPYKEIASFIVLKSQKLFADLSGYNIETLSFKKHVRLSAASWKLTLQQ